MSSDRIMEQWIQNHTWIRALKEAPNTSTLAALLMARAHSPGEVGPFISARHNEHPFDLVVELTDAKQLDVLKVEKAAASIISGMNNDSITEDLPVLQCVFYLAVDLSMTDCAGDIYQWLQLRRKPYADAGQINSIKGVYREGLWALALLQRENDPLPEDFWKSFWTDTNQYWWYPGYLGTLYWDSKEAIKQLALLVSRRVDQMDQLLYQLWFHKPARSEFERYMKIGLITENIWAGVALNTLAASLSKDNKQQLLQNLKAIDVLSPKETNSNKIESSQLEDLSSQEGDFDINQCYGL